MRKQTAQHGFTIVEVMVAVTISLFLLLGVIQIFLANKTTYRLQEASAAVQESGRFGMEFLTKDVRMVGFMGCANSSTVSVTNNINTNKTSAAVDNTVALFDGGGALQGFTYDGTMPQKLTNLGFTTDVVAGTDVLYLQRAVGCEGGDIICHSNTNNNKTCSGGSVGSAQYKIADNTQCDIQQNDILLISNCVTADIHGVTNVVNSNGNTTNIAHGANLNLTSKLSNSYGEGSAVYKMTAEVFYIGFNVAGEPALFRRVLRAGSLVSEELLEGVYDMTILYGYDTDGDSVANRYVPAASVSNWENVINARITLATRSPQDNVLASDDTYTYNGASVTDRRLKRSFTSTITIRNRVK